MKTSRPGLTGDGGKKERGREAAAPGLSGGRAACSSGSSRPPLDQSEARRGQPPRFPLAGRRGGGYTADDACCRRPASGELASNETRPDALARPPSPQSLARRPSAPLARGSWRAWHSVAATAQWRAQVGRRQPAGGGNWHSGSTSTLRPPSGPPGRERLVFLGPGPRCRASIVLSVAEDACGDRKETADESWLNVLRTPYPCSVIIPRSPP